jgi:hypothetical protein
VACHIYNLTAAPQFAQLVEVLDRVLCIQCIQLSQCSQLSVNAVNKQQHSASRTQHRQLHQATCVPPPPSHHHHHHQNSQHTHSLAAPPHVITQVTTTWGPSKRAETRTAAFWT